MCPRRAQELHSRGAHLTFTVEPGALVDSRTGARYAVGGSVLLYVVASSLRRLELKDLPEYIRRLQVPKRHWIQVVEIEWLRD